MADPGTERAPLRIVALASGGGRTVLNLQDAIDGGELPATITRLVVHREEIAAVDRCRARGIDVVVVPAGDSDALDAAIADGTPDLVCLCGYLRHLRIGPWAGRVVNIHPSLLPAHGGRGMYGRHVHAAVLAAGDRESGCTVHFVDEVYDHGPTILQRRCAVEPDDTPDTLAARVFEEECRALPQAIRGLAEGTIAWPASRRTDAAEGLA